MRTPLLPAVAAALLVSAIPAQGVYTVVDPAPDTEILAAMTAAGLTVTSLGQIELLPLPPGYPIGAGGAPNNYFLIATAMYSGPGSVGDWDILTGVYDRSVTPPVFTRTTEFDPINTPDGEFQASMSADLLIGVLDLGSGTSAIGSVCTRASTNVDFTSTTPLSGTPAGYIDPHLCKVNGQWTVMWADPGNAIRMGDLDPATGAVTNIGTASPLWSGAPSGYNHSASAIKRGDDAIAIVHSTRIVVGVSHAMFQSFIDRNPGAQPEVFLSSYDPMFSTYYPASTGSDWLANPDANGGDITYAVSASGYGEPIRLGIVGMGGGRWPAAGGNVNLHAFAPPSANGIVPDWLCWFAFANAKAGTPAPLPPVNGLLGLELASATVLDSFAVIDGGTGIGSIGFNLPAGILSPGQSIPFQPVFLNINTDDLYFGNVADIIIQ